MMSTCPATLLVVDWTLGKLVMLLTVVSWDELMAESSLSPRDRAGVDGAELCGDVILVSVNRLVMCSSFFATILISMRPSVELSFVC